MAKRIADANWVNLSDNLIRNEHWGFGAVRENAVSNGNHAKRSLENNGTTASQTLFTAPDINADDF